MIKKIPLINYKVIHFACHALLDEEFPHEIHHSSLSKGARINAEKAFKNEELKALIATSSFWSCALLELAVINPASLRVTESVRASVAFSGHCTKKSKS